MHKPEGGASVRGRDKVDEDERRCAVVDQVSMRHVWTEDQVRRWQSHAGPSCVDSTCMYGLKSSGMLGLD
jgi:hypothetical protein